MKASELVGLLMQNILEHGDGEVEYKYFSASDGMPIDKLLVFTDEDIDGRVTKCTYSLEYD